MSAFRGAVYFLAGMVVATIGTANLPLPNLSRVISTQVLLPPVLAYAIFYAAFSPRLRLHHAARFGDFSYGAYLYAFPVQQMLIALLRGYVSFAGFIVFSLVAALLAGAMSWYAVERWFAPAARRDTRNAADRGALGEAAVLDAP